MPELDLETARPRRVDAGVHALVDEAAGEHVVILFAERFEQPAMEGRPQRLPKTALGVLVAEGRLEPAQSYPGRPPPRGRRRPARIRAYSATTPPAVNVRRFPAQSSR